MSTEVTEIIHAEVIRRREDQLARVASVRARSAGVLGASGLAATLVGAVADNGGYVVAVVCYLFATIYSVKSMAMRTHKGKSTMRMIDAMIGLDPDAARAEIVADLVVKIERSEALLNDIGGATKVAMGWFVAGTALTTLTAIITMLLSF